MGWVLVQMCVYIRPLRSTPAAGGTQHAHTSKTVHGQQQQTACRHCHPDDCFYTISSAASQQPAPINQPVFVYTPVSLSVTQSMGQHVTVDSCCCCSMAGLVQYITPRYHYHRLISSHDTQPAYNSTPQKSVKSSLVITNPLAILYILLYIIYRGA